MSTPDNNLTATEIQLQGRPRRISLVPREWIVRSALRLLVQGGGRLAHAPAWVAVCDICGVGSSSARLICAEIDVDPDVPYPTAKSK